MIDQAKNIFWLKRVAVITKIALFLLLLIIIVLLVYLNCYPSGHLWGYNLIGEKRSRFMSALEPSYRVSKVINLDGQKSKVLLSNPVYFNLRTVLPFKKAKVFIVYKNPKDWRFRIGGLVNKESWQFDLRDIQAQDRGDGWLIGQVEFDMSNYYREQNQYRFILSLPYVELVNQGDGLAIHEIKVELTREPITIGVFCSKLFKRIQQKLSYYENHL